MEQDGSFEIFLGPEPRGKNGLRTEEETSLLIVRQTFADRNTEEPAELRIENISGPACRIPMTSRQVGDSKWPPSW